MCEHRGHIFDLHRKLGLSLVSLFRCRDSQQFAILVARSNCSSSSLKPRHLATCSAPLFSCVSCSKLFDGSSNSGERSSVSGVVGALVYVFEVTSPVIGLIETFSIGDKSRATVVLSLCSEGVALCAVFGLY